MKSYNVKVEWSGYSRGVAEYCVEAESEEDAEENWMCGELVNSTTIRDDTEVQDVLNVEEVDY